MEILRGPGWIRDGEGERKWMGKWGNAEISVLIEDLEFGISRFRLSI